MTDHNEKINTDLPPLYGITDFAKLIGWSRQKAHVYYKRGKLPEPATYAGETRPLWTIEQIKHWAENINDTSVEFKRN